MMVRMSFFYLMIIEFPSHSHHNVKKCALRLFLLKSDVSLLKRPCF